MQNIFVSLWTPVTGVHLFENDWRQEQEIKIVQEINL